jgi:hypothetical protein
MNGSPFVSHRRQVARNAGWLRDKPRPVATNASTLFANTRTLLDNRQTLFDNLSTLLDNGKTVVCRPVTMADDPERAAPDFAPGLLAPKWDWLWNAEC